jgi:hypothetical protein
MRVLIALSLSALLAAPALADPPHLEHEDELIITELAPAEPTPVPTASPAPTPSLEPRCEDAGPLVRCRAVQDPAAVLNQRVTNVEQQQNLMAQQVGQAIRQLNERVTALEPKKGGK